MPLYHPIGNPSAQAIIERMLEMQRVPNTLLFSGTEGVGKSLFALNLIAGLMGPAQHDKIEKGLHPDVHIYRPDGKNGLHSISSMRQIIQEMHLPPFEGPCKVFVVHDAERMLPTASNALLKTFEEPSPESYIILLSCEPEALLPTILSRCRKVPFFPIAIDLMVQYMQENWQKDAVEARRIALLAQGSLGRAHRMISQKSDKASEIVKIILCNPPDYPSLLSHLEKLEGCVALSQEDADRGFAVDPLFYTDAIFEEIFYWYRDLNLLASRCDPKYLFHQDLLPELGRMAGKAPPIERVFEVISECRLALQRNVKLRVVLEHLFASIQNRSRGGQVPFGHGRHIG